MADPIVEYLKAVAQQYMANNCLDNVNDDVIAHVITAAGNNKIAAAQAIASLLGNA